MKMTVSEVIVNATRNLVKTLCFVLLFVCVFVKNYCMIFGASIILQMIMFKKFDFFNSPSSILITMICPIVFAIILAIEELKELLQKKED